MANFRKPPVVTTNLKNSAELYSNENQYITGKLFVDGNIIGSVIIASNFTGSFVGDGSGLTGISTDPFPYTGSATISGSLNITGSSSHKTYIASASSSPTVINCSLSNTFYYHLSSSVTFSFSNMSEGQTIVVGLQQDTNGSHTCLFSQSLWAGGTPPTITTATSSKDVLTFIKLNNNIFGSYIQDFS